MNHTNHADNGSLLHILENDPVIQDLQQTIAQLTATEKRPSPPFRIRDADQLAVEGRHLPEMKKVFGNFIVEGAAVLFPSERGIGKTFFLMQLCLAVSKGYCRLLNEPIELHGNTLYLDFELGERSFKRRLARLYDSVNLPQAPVSPYKTLVVNAKGSLNQSMEEFTRHVDQHKPVLVVIDNLRTAFRDTDNEKNSAMAHVISNLMDMKNEKGFALVVAHHTKKNTAGLLTHSDLQSGAGAITDLFDADFFLRRSGQDKNYRLLIRKKSRFCEEAEGAKLILFNPDTLWFEFLEEEVEESEHVFAEKTPEDPRANRDGKEESIAQMLRAGTAWRAIIAELGVSSKRIAKVKASLSFPPLTESVLSVRGGKESESTPQADSLKQPTSDNEL
jgi:hypothetical protein